MSHEDEEIEGFMGYMATHPEDFPEEHQAMNDFLRGGPKKAARARRREQLDYDLAMGYRRDGDFRYLQEDCSKAAYRARCILLPVTVVSMVLYVIFFLLNDEKAFSELLQKGRFSPLLLIPPVFLASTAAWLILSSKKLRIRKDCHWKYGLGPPPAEMQEKISRYLKAGEDMPAEEREQIRDLLERYPLIQRPAASQTDKGHGRS